MRASSRQGRQQGWRRKQNRWIHASLPPSAQGAGAQPQYKLLGQRFRTFTATLLSAPNRWPWQRSDDGATNGWMRARSTPADLPPARSTRIRPVPCKDTERSSSHQHHQRADSAWLPIKSRSRKARRSASAPAQALRGNAAGEPCRQLVDLPSVRARRGDRRPAPAQALRGNAAGEPSRQLVDLASIRVRRGDRRPTPAQAFRGNAAGEPSRQLVDRASIRVRRGDRRPTPAQALRGNAAGEPSRQLVDRADERPGRRVGRREIRALQ